jgi:HAD superfamily hydrolase (TIGR01450 family)
VNGPLAEAQAPLLSAFDVVLTDLDGVLYIGAEPVPSAAPALAWARDQGVRAAFVTNNASRTPDRIAEHLTALGIRAQAADVVTSAMAVARILTERLEPGSPVLVAGAEGLRREVAAAGFRQVDSADDTPAAVAQGYDPTIDYPRLAEACLAIGRGALWVAANTDATVPSPRGLLPGMGSLVALVATATATSPVVAGKPELALHRESLRRSGASRPLIVGDRLDTDIEGANRGNTPSLLVLTGVTDPVALLAAGPQRRPTYVAEDLWGLRDGHPEVRQGRCREWAASVVDGEVTLRGGGEPIDALRAMCGAVWAAADAGTSVEVRAAAERLPAIRAGSATATGP